MIMQDNHQIPKMAHHSQAETEMAFGNVDATREHSRQMRSMIKAERERQCIAEFQKQHFSEDHQNDENSICREE
ncbi:hypothetical protein L278_00750 [Mannheimia haemolytica D35]|nr:hypothetical protein L278_00750 [Mannheimia haemolytica D35]